jgi:head-tail adaptor
MAHAVDPGSLRHRLVFEQPVDAPDGAGGFKRTWAEAGVGWGSIENLPSSAGSPADRTGRTVGYRISLRFREDLTINHRVRAGTRLFIIRSIHDITGERRFLVLLAEDQLP